MVRLEERKITRTKKGAILGLNPEYLDEIGISVGKKYTVIYDENSKTITISNIKIESIVVKS